MAPAVAGAEDTASVGSSGIGSSFASLGAASIAAGAPFSKGALKSLYSSCHFAGVASLGLPYFYTSLVNSK